MHNCTTKIILALDFSTEQQVFNLTDQLNPNLCKLKIGKELFTYYGPSIVEKLQKRGFDIFLDLKFHDIPNTTANAVAAAASLGVWMVNVHCSGGLRMMQACYDILTKFKHKPLLIGVTVLTSMEQSDLINLGIKKTPQQLVLDLAKLANQANLDGLVCSSQEVNKLKLLYPNLFLVTPGIRLDNNTNDDQRRIMTPKQAILNGSDYLVIGRPITQAKNPLKTLNSIITSI